jgi:co-chaperonin GroES (HSP10)
LITNVLKWFSFVYSKVVKSPETSKIIYDYICIINEKNENNMAKVNPTKILVEEIAEQPTTSGGIIIPTMVKDDSLRGKVLLVGSGTPELEMVYAVGDTVLFNPHAGRKFTWSGKEVKLIDINDVFLGL